MKKKMAKDRVLAIILLIIAAFFIWQSFEIDPRATEGDPGARAFPILGSGVIILCAVILLIKPGPDSKRMDLNKDEKKRLLIMIGLYFLIIAGGIVFGILYILPVVLFIVSYLFSKSSRPDFSTKKRVIQTLIYTVCLSAALYAIYVLLLDIQIRPGILFR